MRFDLATVVASVEPGSEVKRRISRSSASRFK
jgi:hypothetical protein